MEMVKIRHRVAVFLSFFFFSSDVVTKTNDRNGQNTDIYPPANATIKEGMYQIWNVIHRQEDAYAYWGYFLQICVKDYYMRAL